MGYYPKIYSEATGKIMNNKNKTLNDNRDWYEYLSVEDFCTPAVNAVQKVPPNTQKTVQQWLSKKPDAVYVHELRGFKRSEKK